LEEKGQAEKLKKLNILKKN